jgi:hypothetical protein
MKKKQCGFIFVSAILFVIFGYSLKFPVVRAQNNSNTITFENHSGQPALVKLIGPTSQAINVPKGQNQTVNVASGEYHILVRYGSDPANYTYTRGDTFIVRQTETRYSAITITLHKVIGGNYEGRTISRKRFDQDVISDKKKTSIGDTVIVRTFPSGLKTYVVPEKYKEGPFGISNLESEDYFVGHTPLEVELEPGEYWVNIVYKRMDFREDGEDEKTFSMTNDDKNWLPRAKAYKISKRTGHQPIVTALFWHKKQSLKEFVKTLPDKELFKLVDVKFFQDTFKEHRIPSKDWKYLLLMLRRTGKAVWYGDDPTDYVFVYYTEQDRLAVIPVKTIALPTTGGAFHHKSQSRSGNQTAQSVNVDLLGETLSGKPLNMTTGDLISIFGNSTSKDTHTTLNRALLDYSEKYGFSVFANLKTKEIFKYSFYLENWNSTNPTKVPKNNRCFQGSFSCGILPGAPFGQVLKNIKNEFRGKFVALEGKWCFYYSGSCNELGKVIILKLKNNGYASLEFDESSRLFHVSLSIDSSHDSYLELQERMTRDGKMSKIN